MKNLINVLLPYLIETILKLLTPEQLTNIADKLLDWLETAIEKTENDYDNMVVLPLIGIVREAFDIEDND